MDKNIKKIEKSDFITITCIHLQSHMNDWGSYTWSGNEEYDITLNKNYIVCFKTVYYYNYMHYQMTVTCGKSYDEYNITIDTYKKLSKYLNFQKI